MITATRVSKSYGSKAALSDVSFEAPDGAVTGFVGPNGAGKSTLLRILTGLSAADTGSVTVDGIPFTESRSPGAALGAFLSAELIPDHLTARSHLTYACDVQGLPRTRVDEVLEVVGLSRVRSEKVKEFSLGMRQRLGIGAALLARPRNLVLDEPINGLDPDGIHWLRTLVRDVADAGGTVLLSSHHMAELALVADHVVMISGGRVVRTGRLDAFVAEESLRTYVESPDLEAARALLTARGFAPAPHLQGLLVPDAEPLTVGRLLFGEGPGASHLRVLERSLEETYFDHVSASAAPLVASAADSTSREN